MTVAAWIPVSSMIEETPRILVVDDTPQNIRLLDAVLSPRGYAVIPATSGLEALNIVADRLLT